METQVYTTSYSHMPDHARRLSVSGQTVRKALGTIRAMGRRDFGDIGSLRAELSDGTTLAVMNQAASDGGALMASQQIVRLAPDTGRIVRRYDW